MKCMKKTGFGKLGPILLSGLIAGACSPVAPSVSKFSNAAGDKISPTDPSKSISVPASLIAPNIGSVDAIAEANTEILTEAQFDEKLQKHNAKKLSLQNPILMLRADDTNIFKERGSVLFRSETNKIKGRETALLKVKTTIYLVVQVGVEAIEALQFRQAKAALAWHPGNSVSSTGLWELSISKPSIDGAEVANADAGKIRNDLKKEIVQVAVEFQVD